MPVWTVGDRLAKARDFAGLTQQQMAERLDMGRRSIVRYEARSNPPRSIVLAYAAVTGVPVEWLDGTMEVTNANTQRYSPYEFLLALEKAA